MAKTITVIGIGPGGKKYLTIEAFEKIKQAKHLYFRTEKHPIVDYFKSLGIKFQSFDDIYDTTENFDDVYNKIVDKLIELCENRHVVYAVPGSPFIAENTVQKLIDIVKEKRKDIKLEFVAGVSFIEAIIDVLEIDPIVNGLKIIDALQMDNQKPDFGVDIIVTQVYNKLVASEVKLKLMEFYDDEYEITIIRGAGIESEQKIIKVPLYELDRAECLDHLTSIFIPKVGNDIRKYKMDNLVDIMKKLRSNEGCPWDRQQNHQSLKPYLIEESYEVLEALENDDMELLEEELGDLLLQIVFHSQIASENGYFNLTDVITGICNKLISRHPHVFGELKVENAEKVLINWEEIKRKEKEEKSYTESLMRIPRQLPALMKSYKIQEKAAKVGFDWDNVHGAMKKVNEELKELTDVLNSDKKDKIFEEIGDLLFAIVNVARFLDVRPELALNNTIEKFIRRFDYIEQSAKENNQKLEDMTLEEMDNLWNAAKKIEKKY